MELSDWCLVRVLLGEFDIHVSEGGGGLTGIIASQENAQAGTARNELTSPWLIQREVEFND